MPAFLFYFFSGLTIVAALFVVLNRNAVNSAMCMIVALAGIAGLFVLLQSYFLAVLQIIVYAGAVMVLFLFIIMLLDTEARKHLRLSGVNSIAGVVALLIVAAGAGWLAHKMPIAMMPADAPNMPADNNPMSFVVAIKAVGYGLFTRYQLPFQVAGFLLLIAMVGVIVLSKRHTSDDKTGEKDSNS